MPTMRWLVPFLLAACSSSSFCAETGVQGSNPRWHCWADCGLARTVTCGAGGAWFAGAGVLWRHDCKTRKNEVFTPMDGLPIDWDVVTQAALAEDGTYVIAFEVSSPLFIRRPGQRWRQLARPLEPGAIRSVAFGPNNRLYYLHWKAGDKTNRIFRLDDDKWTHVLDCPGGGTIVPLKEGFLLGHLRISVGPGRSRSATVYLGPNGGEPFVYPQESELSPMDTPGRFFHAAGETYVTFHRWMGGETVYRRVTPTAMVKDERAANLDPARPLLAAQEDLRAQHLGVLMQIVSGRPGPLLPPHHLGNNDRILDGRRYGYDAAKRTWAALDADMAPVFRGNYDPATREAWWSTTVGNKQVRQLVRLEGKNRIPLRSIPEPQVSGDFEVRDSAGRWWGAGRLHGSGEDKYIVFRIDPGDDTLHRYPCDRGIAGGYRPQVQISPKGSFWVWTEKQALRYDSKTEALVADEPWEDFAFAFGPWRVSMAGPIGSGGQPIRRCDNGQWKPLADPYGGGDVLGNPAMIRGDRILITTRMGVAEYDAWLDRWALLKDGGDFKGGYTPAGQRVFRNRMCVLVLEGDPLDPQPSLDKEMGQELAVMNELLKLMDDERWRVREEATQRLKKLHPKLSDRLKAAAEDTSFSLEVRARIKLVLQESSAGQPPQVRSLFRTMHPLVAP